MRSTGFYRNKAKSLVGMASTLMERFDGDVPTRMSDWVTVPGVGRKTANVVRSIRARAPRHAVDTHVLRLSRTGWAHEQTDPGEGRDGAQPDGAGGRAGTFSLRVILHGRPGVLRPQAGVRRVRAGGLLPFLGAAG
ncbi:MAG: hypothetical protein R2701_07280 [Acidimicrobiales bacterium]